MSHVSGRASSWKDKASSAFFRHVQPQVKCVMTTTTASADCKGVNCSRSDSHLKMKRLRSRKERNQIRNCVKEASKCKSHLYSCGRPVSRDVCHFSQCCHRSSKPAAFSKVVTVTHEPSIITDKRLLGHKGLFNHEVKSIDIERLLTEQTKWERSEKLAANNNSSLSYSTSTADPPHNESQRLLDPSEKAERIEMKTLSNIEMFGQTQEQTSKPMESNSQCSDLTPGQRQNDTHEYSTEQKNDSSKLTPVARIRKSIETQPVPFESILESHQTPSSCNEYLKNLAQVSVTSFKEHTPKMLELEANQTLDHRQSPQLPFSPANVETSKNFKTQEDSIISDSVAKSIKAIAGCLCNDISFSLLRNRKLLAQTRDTLLKALRKRHGPEFQWNILKVQQQLYSSGFEEEQEDQEPGHNPAFAEKEEPFLTDDFSTQFVTTSFVTSSFHKNEHLHFDWNSTDWSTPLDQPPDWLEIPTENPIVLDDTFRRRCSPLFSLEYDFRDPFSREREQLFSRSPSCGSRSSSHIEHFFTTTKEQEFVIPDPNQNHNYSNMKRFTYGRSPRSSAVHDHFGLDPYHSEPLPFDQLQSSVKTKRYTSDKSFSEEFTRYHQQSSIEPFSQLSFPSSSPVLRSHHIDLNYYPPSYVLERDHSLSTSFRFPSPEQWSFPPMRLY